MNTKQSTPNQYQTASTVVLTATSGLSGEPCFYGAQQGITSCTHCRCKLICKKSPETQKHSTEFSRLERKKERLVKNLFAKRKIDSLTAISWLGINEEEFIKMFPKKKLSESAVNLMAKGYQECADEDLKIAKDFEQVENELDEECSA